MSGRSFERYRQEGKCVVDADTGRIAAALDNRTAAVLTRALNNNELGPEKLQWKDDPEQDKL